MALKGFKWARFRASKAWGHPDWTYVEVDLDDYDTLDQALNDALEDFHERRGDEIRGSQGEWIDHPPIEWMRQEMDRCFTRASDLLDKRDRLSVLVAKVEKGQP